MFAAENGGAVTKQSPSSSKDASSREAKGI